MYYIHTQSHKGRGVYCYDIGKISQGLSLVEFLCPHADILSGVIVGGKGSNGMGCIQVLPNHGDCMTIVHYKKWEGLILRRNERYTEFNSIQLTVFKGRRSIVYAS